VSNSPALYYLNLVNNNITNLYLGDTMDLSGLNLDANGNPNGQTGLTIHVGSATRVQQAQGIPSSTTWVLPPNTTFSPL